MGVKKAGWGYSFALGCGGLWVKSVWVEKNVKGEEERGGDEWEGEDKGVGLFGKGV